MRIDTRSCHTKGTRGTGKGIPLPTPAVPGRVPSSLPRRIFFFAALFFAALFCAAVAGAAEGGTTLVDVPAGGVLASLVSAAVAALSVWAGMRNRPTRQRGSTRIEDQPIKVQPVAGAVSADVAAVEREASADRWQRNKCDHDNIFPRLASVEARVSRVEGALEQIGPQLRGLDEKLTIVLRSVSR